MTPDEMNFLTQHFTEIKTSIEQLDLKLTASLEAFDARMKAGFDRLTSLESKLDGIEEGQAGIAADIAILRKDNRHIDEKINVFIEEVIALSRAVHRT